MSSVDIRRSGCMSSRKDACALFPYFGILHVMIIASIFLWRRREGILSLKCSSNTQHVARDARQHPCVASKSVSDSESSRDAARVCTQFILHAISPQERIHAGFSNHYLLHSSKTLASLRTFVRPVGMCLSDSAHSNDNVSCCCPRARDRNYCC
jgi:hypothetical protein